MWGDFCWTCFPETWKIIVKSQGRQAICRKVQYSFWNLKCDFVHVKTLDINDLFNCSNKISHWLCTYYCHNIQTTMYIEVPSHWLRIFSSHLHIIIQHPNVAHVAEAEQRSGILRSVSVVHLFLQSQSPWKSTWHSTITFVNRRYIFKCLFFLLSC